MVAFNKNKTVEIDLDEYEEMVRSCEILEALRSAGVDKWDGWEEAMYILEGGE